jgi:hypothetical protein
VNGSRQLFGVWIVDWEEQTLLAIFDTREAAEAEMRRIEAMNEPRGKYELRLAGEGQFRIQEHTLNSEWTPAPSRVEMLDT